MSAYNLNPLNCKKYIVKEGDSFNKICRQFYGTEHPSVAEALIRNNQIIYKYLESRELQRPECVLYPGEEVKIPVNLQYIILQGNVKSSLNVCLVKEEKLKEPVEIIYPDDNKYPVHLRGAIARKRLIYMWEKQVPEYFETEIFNNEIINKIDKQEDIDFINQFYIKQTVDYTGDEKYDFLENELTEEKKGHVFTTYHDSNKNVYRSYISTAGETYWEVFFTRHGNSFWQPVEFILTGHAFSSDFLAEFTAFSLKKEEVTVVRTKRPISDEDAQKIYSILDSVEYEYMKNHGALLTDEWGHPHLLKEMKDVGEYLLYDKDKNNKDESFTYFNPIKIEEIGIHRNYLENRYGFYKTEYDFGFYSPKILEFFQLRDIVRTRNPEEEELLYDFRVSLNNTSQYSFAFTPLDTIWGHDATPIIKKSPEDQECVTAQIWDAYDELGFDSPPEHVTGTKYSQSNIKKTIIEGKDLKSEERTGVKFSQKKPDTEEYKYTSIRIPVDITLAEYISLLKKYTYELESKMIADAKNKEGLFKTRDMIHQISDLIDLMIYYPKTDIPAYKRADQINKYKSYQKRLDESAERIDALIDKDIQYHLSDDSDNIHEYDTVLSSYESQTEIAQKILDILECEDFNAKFDDYMETIKNLPPNKFQFDFFSFKHPTNTLCDTLQSTFTVLSRMTDKDFVFEQVYKKHVQPLELLCEENFNNDVELIDTTQSLLDDISTYDLLDAEAYNSSRDAISSKSTLLPEPAGDNKNSVLAKIWSVASNSHVTGFWNNQEGPACYMARIVVVFAYFRHKMIVNPADVRKVCEYQLKVVMELARTLGAPRAARRDMTRQLKRVQKKFLREVTRNSKVAAEAVDEWKNKMSNAPALINNLSCGIQFFVAAQGVYSFAKKSARNQKLTPEDYTAFVSSISNGGLAISGITPKKWANIMGKLGRGFAGAGCLSDAVSASIFFLKAGEKWDTNMQVICGTQALAGIFGAYLWFSGVMSSVPVYGWILLGVSLGLSQIKGAYERSKTGTENMLNILVDNFFDNETTQKTLSASTLIEMKKIIRSAFWHIGNDNIIEIIDELDSNYRYNYSFENVANVLDPGIKATGRMGKFLPLDYKWSTFILIGYGWSRENILSIHADGQWFGTEDDDEVRKNTSTYYREYSQLLESVHTEDKEAVVNIRTELIKIKENTDQTLRVMNFGAPPAVSSF